MVRMRMPMVMAAAGVGLIGAELYQCARGVSSSLPAPTASPEGRAGSVYSGTMHGLRLCFERATLGAGQAYG